MSYGYSDDLRSASLAFYDAGDRTQREVSEVFGISLKTFGNWVRLRKSGDFSRRSSEKARTSYKLNDAALRDYISENPDAYNHEVAAVFGVHPTTIFYARRRLGISRKKNGALSGAK